MTIGLKRHPRRHIAFGTVDFGSAEQTFAAIFDPDQNATISTAGGTVDQSFLFIKFLLTGSEDKCSLAIATNELLISHHNLSLSEPFTLLGRLNI